MAINMALGFLFLGHGSHSFTRDDLSIALLLIACYPQFPVNPSDNKYHLQALRHFYVIAIKPKLFHTINVDTNSSIPLQIEIEIDKNGKIEKQQHTTPLLLKENYKILSVKVIQEDYYELKFDFDKTKPLHHQILYVKK